MKKRNCSLFDLKTLSKQKRVVIFGMSKHLINILQREEILEINNIVYIVDNDVTIQGKKVNFLDKTLEVKPPTYLIKEKDIMVLIAVGIPRNALAILHQMENLNLDDTVECYSLCVIEETQEYDDTIMENRNQSTQPQIEKTIHSFWFSGEKKPEKYQRCIDSWKKYCPDYKVIEWNASNYDITRNKYMLQAYERKRWAFVSDYARLDVVYNYGGIYMDMDVELLRSLDSLLDVDAFFSFDSGRFIDLGSGFGAVQGHPLIRKLLSEYGNIDFEEDLLEGKLAIPQPTRLRPVFEGFGYEGNNRCQIVNGVLFMSPNYFRIISEGVEINKQLIGSEYAIHRHNAGWWDEKKRKQREESMSLLEELKRLFEC